MHAAEAADVVAAQFLGPADQARTAAESEQSLQRCLEEVPGAHHQVEPLALQRQELQPVQRERFDLVMRPWDFFEVPLQALFAFGRGPHLARRAEELGGYDVSGFGRVRRLRRPGPGGHPI